MYTSHSVLKVCSHQYSHDTLLRTETNSYLVLSLVWLNILRSASSILIHISSYICSTTYDVSILFIVQLSWNNLKPVPSYLLGTSATKANDLELSLRRSIKDRAARTHTFDPSIIFGSLTPTHIAGNVNSTGSLNWYYFCVYMYIHKIHTYTCLFYLLIIAYISYTRKILSYKSIL